MSVLLAGVVVLAALAGPAGATIVQLVDLNSQVTIDTGSDAGMSELSVDGDDCMKQQWFWYRLGPTGGEASIDTLSQTGLLVNDTNFNAGNDQMIVRYTHTDFVLETTYLLTGGAWGSGTADVAEIVKITSTSSRMLDFHLFQYCDFDLGTPATNDTAWITGGNTAYCSGAGGALVSETVVATMPDHLEVGLFSATRDALNDALPTTLNDIAGPLVGDVTWAFQWDFLLGEGESAIISKDKVINVPEPATLGLLAIGGLALLRRRT